MKKTTGELIELAQQLTQGRQTFSVNEIAFFEKRAEDFMASGEKGCTAEESIALLKKRMK